MSADTDYTELADVQITNSHGSKNKSYTHVCSEQTSDQRQSCIGIRTCSKMHFTSYNIDNKIVCGKYSSLFAFICELSSLVYFVCLILIEWKLGNIIAHLKKNIVILNVQQANYLCVQYVTTNIKHYYFVFYDNHETERTYNRSK